MGAVCEKQLTFLCTSPYEYVQYNVWGPVPRVGRPTFVFKKCSDKIYVHD